MTPAAGLGLALASAQAAEAPASPTPTGVVSAAPILMEHRYRLSAAIRPFFFWVGASNVGGARIVWRGDGGVRRGYELLLGSDPRRAPRKINRWGWVREDVDESGAAMLGLMNRAEDDTLDQARSRLAREGKEGYFFKVIKTQIAMSAARSESTTVCTSRDYTIRDLGELWSEVQRWPGSPRIKTAPLPEGTRPGLLIALADLMQEGVDAARAPGTARRPLAGRTLPFTFNSAVYDLTLQSVERVGQATHGGRRYQDLLRMEFESLNREKRSTERFTFVVATSGTLASVPVYLKYQPKWWVKVEAILDETETL